MNRFVVLGFIAGSDSSEPLQRKKHSVVDLARWSKVVGFRFPIRFKLACAFSVVIALGMMTGLLAIWQLEIVNASMDHVLSVSIRSRQLAQQINLHTLQSIRSESAAVLAKNPEEAAKYVAVATAEHDKATEILNERLANAPDDTKPYFGKVLNTIYGDWEKQKIILDYSTANSNAEAHNLAVKRGMIGFEKASEAIGDLIAALQYGKVAVDDPSVGAATALRGALSELWTKTLLHLGDTTLESVAENDKALKGRLVDLKKLQEALRDLASRAQGGASPDAALKALDDFAKVLKTILKKCGDASFLNATEFMLGAEATQ